MVRDILTVFALVVPYSIIVYVLGYRDGMKDKAPWHKDWR